MKELLETLLESDFEDIFQPLSDEEVEEKGLRGEKKLSIFRKRINEVYPEVAWHILRRSNVGHWIAYPYAPDGLSVHNKEEGVSQVLLKAISILKEVGLEILDFGTSSGSNPKSLVGKFIHVREK